MKIKYNLFFSTLFMMCATAFATTDVFAALTLPTISVKNSNTKTKASVKPVVCNAGYYLPKNSSSCKSCSSLGERYYCPGGSFVSSSSDFGINECEPGKIANSKHTECVTKKATKTNTLIPAITNNTVTPVVVPSIKPEPVITPKVVQPAQPVTTKCGAGQYLPANASSCTTCKDRYYVCIGGTFPVKSTNDQGIKKCNSGLVANSAKTQCVTEQVKNTEVLVRCDAGQYLPKNSQSCSACASGDRYYCPGGTFTANSSVDYGLKQCTNGMVANGSHTSCVAMTVKCNPGQYLPKKSSSCSACSSSDERYYCPGGTFTSGSIDMGLKMCVSGKVADKNHASCVSKNVRCDAGQYLPKNSTSCKTCSDDVRYYCPGGTFTSGLIDMGLKSCGTGKIANDKHTSCVTDEKAVPKITCDAGQYLPKNTQSCSACTSGNRYYCPGGTFKASAVNMGLKTCAKGKIANSNHSACIDEPPVTVNCQIGQYLPRNAESCAKCLSAKYYFCPGGTYTVSPFDQGLDLCDDDQQANEEHTACNNLDPAMIHVPSGYYLPANSERPEECPSGANKYCVGGGFFKSGMVQGMKDCPMNTKTNEKKDGCMMSFSAEQMKRNKTNDECWLKKTSEEYKKCVFGK